jgi:hypothetical protein
LASLSLFFLKKSESKELDHLPFRNQPCSSNLSIKSNFCPECKKERTAVAWCKTCDVSVLKEKFSNWASGNSKIDEFIRYTQLSANENMDYLEWIDFDQFELIKNTNKRGAFSSTYSAVWLEGPRWKIDEEAEVWTRNGPIKVILKRLDNFCNVSKEFIDQVSIRLYI